MKFIAWRNLWCGPDRPAGDELFKVAFSCQPEAPKEDATSIYFKAVTWIAGILLYLKRFI